MFFKGFFSQTRHFLQWYYLKSQFYRICNQILSHTSFTDNFFKEYKTLYSFLKNDIILKYAGEIDSQKAQISNNVSLIKIYYVKYLIFCNFTL